MNISKRFDPFVDRMARDIRNSFSEAFVTSLAALSPDEYLNAARDWREKNLKSVYAAYIEDRLVRYDHVFNVILEEGIIAPLPQSIVVWNQSLFFEFHDHLEAIWKASTGDERQALKGLIKAAAVYIHLEHQHGEAAKSLAGKSYHLLRQYSHCLTFITNYKILLGKLKNCEPDPPRLEISTHHH